MKYIVATALFALASAFPSPVPQGGAECSLAFTDSIIFDASMAEFQSAKASLTPSGCNWEDNGCTASPDQPFGFEFLESCQRHDFGYRNYKDQGRFSEDNRKLIDDQFLEDMNAQCQQEDEVDICEGTAQVYYFAVRNFGSKKRSME